MNEERVTFFVAGNGYGKIAHLSVTCPRAVGTLKRRKMKMTAGGDFAIMNTGITSSVVRVCKVCS